MFKYIIELKIRFFYVTMSWSLLISLFYWYKESILFFLSIPVINLNNLYFIYTNLTEPFWTYLYIVIFLNCFTIIPFLIFQFWLFFKPGLYKSEKCKIKNLLIVNTLTCILGSYLVYNYFIPYSWLFFFKVSEIQNLGMLNLHFEAKLNEYIDLIFDLYLYCFILTQILSFFIYFLIYLGKNNLRIISFSRKYVYVILIIFSSIITPPDIISQVIISIPLILCYEILLFIYFITDQ